jgi:citrate synthase
MSDLTWNTSITKVEPNELRLRGYRIDELMGKIAFAEVIFLAFKGRLPSQAEGKLMDAIFVSSIDHGPTPPSALATRTAASTGASLNAAVAAGILSINRFHGGAIHDCMGVLEEGLLESEQSSDDFSQIASSLVTRYRSEKKRIPGLGHRIHTDDPRTKKLFALAEELQLAGRGVALLQAIREYIAEQGKQLPINIDGAIAALLIDLEFPQELANAFFIIARVSGLVAHYQEEINRERPMRRIHPTDHKYDGPPDRSLEDHLT